MIYGADIKKALFLLCMIFSCLLVENKKSKKITNNYKD